MAETTEDIASGENVYAEPLQQEVPSETPNIEEPWERKVILSLDGGGVRGISSLLILRRLMQKVARRHPEHCVSPDCKGDIAPAEPCHYFDLMVGTSTGGLIAVMLGRLRMSIDKCLKEYFCISEKVFGSPKSLHKLRRTKYHTSKIEDEMKRVIRNYSTKKNPEEPLRQRDHEGFDKNGEPTARCCSSAVLSVTSGENTDEIYIFRSYDLHFERDVSWAFDERNYGPAFKGAIWEACRATTAAPTFFNKKQIGGKKYMDGGVMVNNPSVEAWLEAQRISRANDNRIGFLLSCGTGRSKSESRFGHSKIPVIGDKLAIFKTMKTELTDTEKAHSHMVHLMKEDKSKSQELRYERLTVPKGHKSLEKMALDEWKTRTPTRRERHSETADKPQPQRQRTGLLSIFKRPTDAVDVQSSSSQSSENLKASEQPHSTKQGSKGKRGKKPKKYITVEQIYEATNQYLTDSAVDAQLNDTADRIVAFAKSRQVADAQRWEDFVKGRPSRKPTENEQAPVDFEPPDPTE